MKKIFKWLLISLLIVLVLTLGGLGLYIGSLYNKAQSIPLNEEILAAPALSIEIFDAENKPIKEDNEISRAYAHFELIPQHTKDAFISIEDKTFYNHNGINYKRIAKASLNNIKSRSLKEGASTITQQLVKNTQLTSEKTFSRKINEIALAKKVESKYDKDKILEMYLNAIYFGNNCYGIESAANYYFSKETKDLSLEESALLAGIIKSPSKYSPIKHQDNALKRRNLVLCEMEKDQKITPAQRKFAEEKKLHLNLSKEKKNRLNSYSQAALDESENILRLPARQIAINGYKIYTYQDVAAQQALESAFKNTPVDCDYGGIVINNETGHVSAYIGEGNYKILEAKRQPGSCIKPILVYGPALNEDLIYPCSQLLDEKITIGNYSPKNVGNKYHGYVSAREALSKSMNIPAIKVLSYVGTDKAKAYAREMGIEFDVNDDSYSIALGGMSYGCTLSQLAGAYSCIANQGIYNKPSFVSFITDKNGKIVYINQQENKKVLRDDSAYLLTDMLKTCAQSGTGRKLASLEKEIATKTGTVGRSGSNENSDAWNISYTQQQTCGIWLGNLDNTPISYAGGNQPTLIAKDYFAATDDDSSFLQPSSIVEKDVDSTTLNESHKVSLASKYMPQRYTQKELFSSFNLPEISNKFTEIQAPNITSYVNGNNAVLEFDAKDYQTYKIYNTSQTLKEVSGQSGQQKLILPLKNKEEKIYFENYYSLSPDIKIKKEITFIKKTPKEKEKWYI